MRNVCIILPRCVQNFSRITHCTSSHIHPSCSPSHLHFKHHPKIDNLLLFWHFSVMKNPSCIIRRLMYYRDRERKTSLRHEGKRMTIVGEKKKIKKKGRWWSKQWGEGNPRGKIVRFHSARRWVKAKNNVFHLYSAIYVFTPIKTHVSSERRFWRPAGAPENKKCQTGEKSTSFRVRVSKMFWNLTSFSLWTDFGQLAQVFLLNVFTRINKWSSGFKKSLFIIPKQRKS